MEQAGRTQTATTAISDALVVVLRATAGAGPWTVVDLGGGTGGFAVPLAADGHSVTVVDPSPDALAALERRATDAGAADRVTGILGDAAELSDLFDPASADAVLCHGVLERVDDPDETLQAIATVLRPSGVLSIVVQQYRAVVLARALSGRLSEAVTALHDPDGRWSEHDSIARRFDEQKLRGMLTDTGFAIAAAHGVRTLGDLVPAQYTDTDPAAARALADLDRRAGIDPILRAIAANLHVLAVKHSEPAD